MYFPPVTFGDVCPVSDWWLVIVVAVTRVRMWASVSIDGCHQQKKSRKLSPARGLGPLLLLLLAELVYESLLPAGGGSIITISVTRSCV